MVGLSLSQAFTPPPPIETHNLTCRTARITGYVRGTGSPFTYDGTSIWTDEPIAAASFDIPIDTMVEIEGLGVHRIADRGRLSPTWIDVATWSAAEAYALTGYRQICY
jgi:hypothetical protein